MSCDKNIEIKEKGEKIAKNSQELHDYDAFVVPEILCQCLQRCTERVGASLIQKVCMFSSGIKDDKIKQKQYLASLILGKEKKIDNTMLEEGKRLRKMSYRYFIPVLTQNDEIFKMKSETGEQFYDFQQKIPKIFKDKNRDHIEVCLKAFTTIHMISEKKVIVTRNIFKLRNSLKCSKPFPCHMLAKSIDHTVTMNPETSIDLTSNKDLTVAVAKWLYNNRSTHSNQFHGDPKSYLPEGLILPDSVDCMPIFANGLLSNPQEDSEEYLYENSLNIVENFFHNQLWKLEYLSNPDHK